MISSKIKALLKMYNKSHADSANVLNINRQSFTNKLNRNGFKSDDLVRLAKLTNTRLAFIDEDNNPVIIFDETDLKGE